MVNQLHVHVQSMYLTISVMCTCSACYLYNYNVLCSSVISPCGRCIIVTASVKILEPLHKFMLRMEVLSQR